jgi:tetratricopeptide (TPR) repeat protein
MRFSGRRAGDRGRRSRFAALHLALELRSTLRGPDHEEVALSLRSLGNMHLELAKLDSADAYLDRSEAILGAQDSQDPVAIAGMVVARGDLLLRLGDYAGAIEAYRSAASAHTAAFGEDHPDTSASANATGPSPTIA